MNIIYPINYRQSLVVTVLIIFVLGACFAAIVYGGLPIDFTKLVTGNLNDLEIEVLGNIRTPRVVLAVLVGAGLGVSGAALQGLFRNPLADPSLIGVSAGAAFGAVVAIVLINSGSMTIKFGHYLIPFAAVLGSLLIIIIIFSLTSSFTQSGITYMLLIGIALNALATVGIGFLTFISTDSELRGLTYWMMGSYGAASWDLLVPAIIIILFSILGLIFLARKLDIMQLGEIEALRVGIDVKRVKRSVIILSALMIGASVSLSGIIGFIGLVVPHLVRLLGGVNHFYLLIASALMGITISVLADLFSRLVIQPAELPVGLATSALGAPFFLWLVLRLKKN